jgi:predicted TIM-barrel fold metal-dependent hydrolase
METNENRLPNALVASVNLTDDQLEKRLLTLTNQFKNVRGIRQMLNWLDSKAKIYTMCDRPDYLIDDKWKKGFSLLNKYGLSFDLQIYQHQMNDAAQLAREHLDTTIILNHCGKSIFRKKKNLQTQLLNIGMPYDLTSMDQWKTGMSILAQQPNISCKLSGLVMFQHSWTLESLRPFIEYALNVFGTRRCLFGSNFPVDKLNATFKQLIQTYIEIAKQEGLNQNEIEQVFYSNACRIYRL